MSTFLITDGTSGADTLSGSIAGADLVNGSTGNDLFIYNPTTAGGSDTYIGGRQIDTLEFRLTSAQYTGFTKFQVDNLFNSISAQYIASPLGVTGSNSASPLNFGGGKQLSVQQFEKMRVYVDDVLVKGLPPVALTGAVKEDGVKPYNNTPPFADDTGPDIATGLIADDAPPGTTWIIGAAPSNVANYGTMNIDTVTGQWTFDLNDSLPAVQALQMGQTVPLVFSMTGTPRPRTRPARLSARSPFRLKAPTTRPPLFCRVPTLRPPSVVG